MEKIALRRLEYEKVAGQERKRIKRKIQKVNFEI